jgi:hypothetical protein
MIVRCGRRLTNAGNATYAARDEWKKRRQGAGWNAAKFAG